MDLHQEFLKGGNNKSGGINKNKITIAGPKQAFGLILEICIKILLIGTSSNSWYRVEMVGT